MATLSEALDSGGSFWIREYTATKTIETPVPKEFVADLAALRAQNEELKKENGKLKRFTNEVIGTLACECVPNLLTCLHCEALAANSSPRGKED